MSDLQDRIGYHFKNPAYLVQALTHASIKSLSDNERLEFLGDRVLSLVMAEALYRQYPDEAEGDLALRHAALVRAATLADIAREIMLVRYLRMSDVSGNDPGDNVLSDALEAVFGAIYLDGGFMPCAQVVTKLYGDRVAHMVQPPQDPKTALQEWAQARGLVVPEYVLVEKSGPDHAPAFVVEVRVAGQAAQQGTGASRKAAEKVAAQKMLNDVGA